MPSQGNDSYGDDGDDNKWLCDGTVRFKGGCKSGQLDLAFDLYAGTERWSCPDRECDYDLCEMCTRWCIHCEKNNVDIELVEESEAEDSM